MDDTRTKEEIMQAVDKKLVALPREIQNAAAIYAAGLLAGMLLKPSG